MDLRLCPAAPVSRKKSPPFFRRFGTVNLLFARDIEPGERGGAVSDLFGRPRENDLASLGPGPRSHIDDVVGAKDRLPVVFDHDQAVTGVPEPHQDVQKPSVVARMQADAWLIENIEHAGKASN